MKLRLIIQQEPAEAAELSRRQAARKAQRRRDTDKAEQLEAAQYMMLMTKLDAATMPAARLLAL